MNIPENTPWCEKYRVSCYADVRGQELAIDKVKEFLKNFPKKKAMLLHGGPGIGKTSLAYAIASELDAEILELNASDLRNKDQVAKVIGPASEHSGLFRKNKILLIDEVDGISAWKDRGGVVELISIIEKTAFPVIITANDPWQKKFSGLRKKSEMVQLKDLDYKVILDIMNSICEKEKCIMNKDVLTSIAIRARGDLRAAINDLQTASRSGGQIFIGDLEERGKEKTIFLALQHIFKNVNLDSEMLNVFEDVNMSIDEVFLWVEENIPLEYKGAELAKAFDALSRADVFRGRIYRHQHWRFMVYEYFLLGPGIASSKKSNRAGWTSYKKPTRILKIWLQNQRAAKKKSICQKYARYCHISIKQAMKEFMLLRIILKKPEIRVELKLGEEEIEYLDKVV